MTKTKSPYSADFLKKVGALLLEEKAKLERELAKFSKKKSNSADDFDTTFPDYGDKEDENAAEVADYVVNLSLEENLEKSLRDTNQSLARMEKGEYGICKYCHKPIEEKRLLARLTSSSCMSCKKTITQEV
jgi:RNA polymerase-binding transcription factor DksA